MEEISVSCVGIGCIPSGLLSWRSTCTLKFPPCNIFPSQVINKLLPVSLCRHMKTIRAQTPGVSHAGPVIQDPICFDNLLLRVQAINIPIRVYTTGRPGTGPLPGLIQVCQYARPVIVLSNTQVLGHPYLVSYFDNSISVAFHIFNCLKLWFLFAAVQKYQRE